jgi:hypothetical protein
MRFICDNIMEIHVSKHLVEAEEPCQLRTISHDCAPLRLPLFPDHSPPRCGLIQLKFSGRWVSALCVHSLCGVAALGSIRAWLHSAARGCAALRSCNSDRTGKKLIVSSAL